jgi:hypothetical protein
MGVLLAASAVESAPITSAFNIRLSFLVPLHQRYENNLMGLDVVELLTYVVSQIRIA